MSFSVSVLRNGALEYNVEWPQGAEVPLAELIYKLNAGHLLEDIVMMLKDSPAMMTNPESLEVFKNTLYEFYSLEQALMAQTLEDADEVPAVEPTSVMESATRDNE